MPGSEPIQGWRGHFQAGQRGTCGECHGQGGGSGRHLGHGHGIGQRRAAAALPLLRQIGCERGRGRGRGRDKAPGCHGRCHLRPGEERAHSEVAQQRSRRQHHPQSLSGGAGERWWGERWGREVRVALAGVDLIGIGCPPLLVSSPHLAPAPMALNNSKTSPPGRGSGRGSAPSGCAVSVTAAKDTSRAAAKTRGRAAAWVPPFTWIKGVGGWGAWK